MLPARWWFKRGTSGSRGLISRADSGRAAGYRLVRNIATPDAGRPDRTMALAKSKRYNKINVIECLRHPRCTTLDWTTVNSISWAYGWHTVTLAFSSGQKVALHGSAQQRETIRVAGYEHARSLIRDALPHVQAMRGTLGDQSIRWSDEQVLDHLARLLAEHRMSLFRLATGPAAGAWTARIVSAAASAPDNAQRSAVKTAARASASSNTTIDLPPAVIDADFAPVEQDRQAKTLVRAAVDGTPFCEVCEAARLARRAAQPQMEARRA